MTEDQKARVEETTLQTWRGIDAGKGDPALGGVANVKQRDENRPAVDGAIVLQLLHAQGPETS